MLLSLLLSTAACAESYDEIRQDLFELRKSGEVTDILEGVDNDFISRFLALLGIKNAENALYAYKGTSPAPKDSDAICVISFDTKARAKKAYKKIEELDGNDDAIYLKRKGLVVIYGDKDFCEDIF